MLLFALLFPALAAAQDTRSASQLRPEARPDEAVTETGVPIRIDVLANDEGVPDDPTHDIDLQIATQPRCGRAVREGRVIVYTGGSDCVGDAIEFSYTVRLRDPGTGQVEVATGLVSVTLKARAVACDVPNPPGQLIKIEGGRFDKSEIPSAISDFGQLIEEQSFTVAPFCLMLESVSAEEFEKFLQSIPDDERRAKFPELPTGSLAPPEQGQATQGAPASRVSRNLALAFAKFRSEASGRTMTLPTLHEFIAAAWELQRRQAGSREANLFVSVVRSGNLQWTSTACQGSGSFLTIGGSVRGGLTKLCYQETWAARTGFRLVIR